MPSSRRRTVTVSRLRTVNRLNGCGNRITKFLEIAMEVILKEDVQNLGNRGDVVKVAEGYGRNFLLPKKLAMEANAANKAVIVQMKASAVRKSAKEKTEAEALVAQLDAVSLSFTRKVGENDHLFGSVTSAD